MNLKEIVPKLLTLNICKLKSLEESCKLFETANLNYKPTNYYDAKLVEFENGSKIVFKSKRQLVPNTPNGVHY